MKHEIDKDVLGDIVSKALSGEFSKVTYFVSDKLVAKAKRKMFGGKIRKNDRIAQIDVTVGSPNFAERASIKKALKSGIYFPYIHHKQIS